MRGSFCANPLLRVLAVGEGGLAGAKYDHVTFDRSVEANGSGKNDGGVKRVDELLSGLGFAVPSALGLAFSPAVVGQSPSVPLQENSD